MSQETLFPLAESPAEPAIASQAPVAPIAGAKPKSASIIMDERRGITLRSMEDCFIFSRAVIESGMAPKGFSTPQAVLVAIQFGAELGLPPMASLQNVAVINGRPTLWGDAVPGVCNATGEVEAYKDEAVGADDSFGYRVTVQRKGRADPIVRTFTVAMAKKAGLWGKQGPWAQYPERMLLMRARTFAFRDCFPDALRGLQTAEELRDHPETEKNITPRLDDLDKPKVA